MVQSFVIARVLTGLASFGCLVGGIVFFHLASEQTHEKKAEEYSRTVAAWASHRKIFSGLGITGFFWNSYYRSSNDTPILPSTFNVAAAIKHDKDIPKYEPLSYRLDAASADLLPEVKIHEVEWKETGGPESEHGGHLLFLTLNISGSSASMTTEAIPLVRAQLHKRVRQGQYNHCRKRKGAFVGGKCWIYSRLSSICLQVFYDGSAWQFAPRVASDSRSYGCTYKYGNWSATEYKDLDHVPSDPSGEAKAHDVEVGVVQTLIFDDVSITLRSMHDPYLKALEVTEGSLDFGMTATEETLLGIILLVGAVLLALPLAFTVCYHYRKRAKHRVPRIVEKPTHEEIVGMKYAVGHDDEEVYDIR